MDISRFRLDIFILQQILRKKKVMLWEIKKIHTKQNYNNMMRSLNDWIMNKAVYCVFHHCTLSKHWLRGEWNCDKWFTISISVIYLWPDITLRGKLERERLSTPLVTKSSQANLSLAEAPVAHLRAMMKRERERGWGGWMSPLLSYVILLAIDMRGTPQGWMCSRDMNNLSEVSSN